MFKLRIRPLMIAFCVAVCAAFGSVIAIGAYAAQNQAVYGSEHYNAIIRAKDLVADVLPPPAYLIESYLEATLAKQDPASLSVRKERLAELKRQYLERFKFWGDEKVWHSEHGFNEKLYNLVSKDSNAEAMKFWDAVEQDLLPAIASGDPAAIEASYAEASSAYAAHRSRVDEIVVAAQEELTHLDEAAKVDNEVVGLLEVSVVSGAILITLVGFFFLFRRVVQPIGDVTETMKKMASGNLKVSVKGGDRHDEVGDMVRALEVFRAGLLETETMRGEQVKTAAKLEEARRAALRDMASNVESEAGVAVSHVKDQANNMTRLAEVMAGSVANVTEQCEGVAGAAERAMTSASSVTVATQQFSISIQEVSQQLSKARSVTAATVETSERTRVAVSNLAEAISKIGDVANMISEIADQTNLLALNATIEAARAGEAGRGFAVVASEVKSLSGQTARSTEEIRRHVAGIQVVMRETTDVVTEIARQIGSVDEGSTVIAAAMEEQTATIHEIARHVEDTARAAAYVSESVGVVLAEAARTGEGARSLRNSVGDVDESIARLRDTIVRVVRTSTPDVERRDDPRYEIHQSGLLVEKQKRVTIENMSRGGALLAADSDLNSGDSGHLSVAEAQVPFKVLRKSTAGAHVRFDEEKKPASFDAALAQLAKGASTRKVS